MKLWIGVDLLHLIVTACLRLLLLLWWWLLLLSGGYRPAKRCDCVHNLDARACFMLLLWLLSWVFALSDAIFETCSWLVKHLSSLLLLLMWWQDALVDPAWDLTCIIVRKVTLEGKLTTLGVFPRDLALGCKLRWGPQPLLYLLYLPRLNVNRVTEPMVMMTAVLLDLLVYALAIF